MDSDPYAGIGVPIDAAPTPVAPATAPQAATPAVQPAQADPYAQIAAPAPADSGVQTPGDTAAAAPGGFSDEQKQAIQDYIPHALKAADPVADLSSYANQLSGGRASLGNAKSIIDHMRKGGSVADFGWAAPTYQAPAKAAPPNPLSMDNIRKTVGDALFNMIAPGFGAQVNEAAQGPGRALIAHVANSVVGDYGPELSGAMDTVLHGGPIDNNVAHERAILAGETDGHPIASMAGELVGTGIDAALGNEAGVANLGRTGKALAATGTGAVYGSGAAGPGNRLEGGVVGAGLGLATEGLAAGLAARSAAKKAASTANQEFADAAQRQGLSYMAADLPKATKSKFATALSSLTLGAIPLADQGAKNMAAGSERIGQVASNIGSVASDKVGAGQAAQKGARQFVENSQGMLDTLESKIPIPAAAPATVGRTRAALSDLIQSFKSNPKLAAAFSDPRITKFSDALTPQTTQEATGLLDASGNPIMRDITHGGGLSWNDLRAFRSRVGEIIGQPGLASDGAQIGQLRSLYGALSDDIRQTARQYGPSAEGAWSRWNNYARARSNRIENVVSLILGKNDDKGSQGAYEAMQRLAADKGGDPIKLGQALRSMPEDEANSVRATMLHDLGKATKGRQNDTGDAFSTNQFVTNWNGISGRAKAVLFTGEHRKNLDDIVKVFSGMKSSDKFANNSKTGIAIAAAHTGLVSLANPVVGALDAALQFGGGKLLASPAFARKLAATPMNVKAAQAFWSRPWVNTMMVKNPAIAAEIQTFRNAVNDNLRTTSAAASPDPNQEGQAQNANNP